MTALMLEHDLPAIIVGIALCTIAVGLIAFALIGRRVSSANLPLAGAFAALYGLRLFLKTATITTVLCDPAWLHYVHSDLEYLVPVPGALLFQRFFGPRLRWLNRLTSAVVIATAAIAIPYEFIAGRPGALRLIDSFVVVFIAVYFINIFLPAPGNFDDWRLLRAATTIFAGYVLNEHFHVVNLPYGLATEPVGFLIFIGAMVFTLMRQSVRTQMRVASVDGELAAARQIQMSILPKSPPSVRGLDLEAIYAPASEVAGDFYDFVPIDDGSVGILVADVSGHGVPAALVASMLKVAVAGHTEFARQPARLLEELNGFFCGKLGRQFITACYAVVDSQQINLASAGHPAPLLVRENRNVEEIAADGALIGRFRDARFSERTVSMRRGDALVMYTDGITEALSAGGEMWGEERFQEALARGASPHQVLDAVRAWNGSLADDVTLVFAKRI